MAVTTINLRVAPYRLFTKAEAARLPAVIDGVASALELALEAGVERAMDRYNRPGSLGCEELA